MNTHAATLLIARHGEGHCNRDMFVGGPTGCTGLTDLGRHQATRLAKRLLAEHQQQPFDALYTSPLRRTRETASIVATTLNIPITTERALREQDYGPGTDGRPWAELVDQFGGIPSQEPDRPLVPDGETWTHYLRRASTALRRILTRHEGQRILVIGHGETIDASFRLFLNLTAITRGHAGFAAYPTALTRWEQHPAAWTRPDAGWRWMLCAHNDTSHLESMEHPPQRGHDTAHTASRY
jgi:2,3-bisphosphoglycerate-dependent phosphoglycerate mutase